MGERLWAVKFGERWVKGANKLGDIYFADSLAYAETTIDDIAAALVANKCGGTVVEFVPSSELAAAQEEGRDHRRALSLACEAIEEHVSDLAVPADVGFYVAQARAEAKPADGGGE